MSISVQAVFVISVNKLGVIKRLSSTLASKTRWQCLNLITMMEELLEEDPGELLDALGILIVGLLPLSRKLESLYVTGDAM